MTLVLLLLLALSLLTAVLYSTKLRRFSQQAPNLALAATPFQPSPPVVVIVPVYNEAENIESCLLSILNCTTLPAETLEVWMVNDQSSDSTWAIAQALQQRLNDPRLHLLQGQPRPTGEVWMGKNWACTQAVEQTTSEFLLFLDADVRLQPGAIETAVQTMQQEQLDLLSCAPAIECGCLAEWLVQPLIISTILIGFNFEAVNDPKTDTAFAAGPFMLFRRSAYDKIGGHRAVADQVVEDVELARRIKFTGLRLKFILGRELATVRMYRSGAALWEGWTKNFYLATQRNLTGSLLFVGLLLLICTVPWLGLLIGLSQIALDGWTSVWVGILMSAASVIALQYDARRQLYPVTGIAPNYWYLMGLGGVAVAAVAIGSIIKTETGWGWTWRGRPLKLSA
ncbi:glycosyltransferase [Leptolyngbya sp. NK1-12]|uniref:Glycosyltransferase n=1 Tax=Leptolyngbya sp. NK1-12 TaxID=2547451 RepID=A0AA97ALE9_9CYAN|nr:glycosyltransferase family 2 protein [Leptolyngbya sp. NK1-12]WNZ24572.1 glycosyltransferase [Leptolyngbya sp. NK1-12]